MDPDLVNGKWFWKESHSAIFDPTYLIYFMLIGMWYLQFYMFQTSQELGLEVGPPNLPWRRYCFSHFHILKSLDLPDGDVLSLFLFLCPCFFFLCLCFSFFLSLSRPLSLPLRSAIIKCDELSIGKKGARAQKVSQELRPWHRKCLFQKRPIPQKVDRLWEKKWDRRL